MVKVTPQMVALERLGQMGLPMPEEVALAVMIAWGLLVHLVGRVVVGRVAQLVEAEQELRVRLILVVAVERALILAAPAMLLVVMVDLEL
jgi:hypothetical protein